MAKRLALIDSDEVAYKGAFACQESYYVVKDDDKILWKSKTKRDAIESIENAPWDIEKVVEPLDPTIGFAKIESTITRFLLESKSDDYRLFLSGKENFRKSFATLTPYKANRPPKPVNLPQMEEYLRYKGAETVSFLEADDQLSAYQDNVEGYETVICTQDKDLRTVPGLNYNPNTGKITDISVMEARYNFYMQVLIGDPTDSIPHPHGLGIIRAEKMLRPLYIDEVDEVEWYEVVKELYATYLYKTKLKGVPYDFTNAESVVFKTAWYTGQDIDEVLWEVANLLHMHRTLNPEERWERPIG